MGQRNPCETGYRCIWGQRNEWGLITRCTLPVCAIERKADGYVDTIQNRRVVYRRPQETASDGEE